MVPSAPMVSDVFGGTLIGPPSPITWMTGTGHQHAVRIDAQIAGARVSLAPILAEHGNPARTVDAHVQIAPRRQSTRPASDPNPSSSWSRSAREAYPDPATLRV